MSFESIENKIVEENSSSISSSIIVAAAQIIRKLGYQKSTTNKIAERAGISIGSLYQYFQNKDQVFEKLMNKLIGGRTKQLEQILDSIKNLPPKEATKKFIEETVDFNWKNRTLLRNLFVLTPRLNRIELVYNLRNEFASKIASSTKELYPNMSKEQAELKEFICTNAVSGVLDSLLFSTNNKFSRNQIKAELVQLIGSYKNSPSDHIEKKV